MVWYLLDVLYAAGNDSMEGAAIEGGTDDGLDKSERKPESMARRAKFSHWLQVWFFP
jgi:hypothetical protein